MENSKGDVVDDDLNANRNTFIDNFSEAEIKKREKFVKEKLRSSQFYSVNNESDTDSDAWDEMESDQESNQCLFCDSNLNSISLALEHCLTEHNFDLYYLKQKHNMDVYSYIKLINYIRSKRPAIKEIMECVSPVWCDDLYLKPVVEDNWLMFDFEDWEENIKKTVLQHAADNSLDKTDDINIEDLLKKYAIQIEQKEEMLSRAMSDMQKMREITKNLIECNEKVKLPDPEKLKGDSSGYFNTYAHYGIHYEMLQDGVRTETYQKAILENKLSFQNKLVLDLGCGTSILSMFCAQAGANQVIGVDNSDVIYKAMDIVRENGLYNKIKLIHGQIENIKLPDKYVDMIVSEWMGYFLLFEGMLDSFVYARDRYLAPDGILLPNRCTLNLVGCSDTDRHSKLIGFWDNVYGFKMSCMVSEVVAESSVEIVPSETIATTECTILDLDLYTCTKEACSFEKEFKLQVLEDCSVTSIVGYFDTFFTSLPNKFEFSTGPKSTPTHWKQTVFYLKEPIPVKKDDFIDGTIICRRAKNNERSLTVTLKIGNIVQNYNVD